MSYTGMKSRRLGSGIGNRTGSRMFRSRRMNKKGMELPINFLVMLILGLVMFGAAITIVYKIYFSTNDLQKQLDSQTKKQIESELRKGSGEKVMFGLTTKEIKRGDNDVFGIGIRNDKAAETDFYVTVSCTYAYKPDGVTPICSPTGLACSGVCGTWGTGPLDKITILPKEVKVDGIYVIVPKTAEYGTYYFDVQTCTGNWCDQSGSEKYDLTRKLIVKVK
jgi:hypothetical protein